MSERRRSTRSVGCGICGAALRGTDQIVRVQEGAWLHVRCWWDSGLAQKKPGRPPEGPPADRPRRPAA